MSDMAMTLRLTDDDCQRLDDLAVTEGRSKQEVLRSALSERWARQHKEQRIDEVMGRVLPRYQGLLDKFGTA